MGYYYFDFKDIAKQGVCGLLTSLIAQLGAKSDACYQILSDLYTENDAGSQQPDNHALTECLKAMLKLPMQPMMYIIMDALDECPNTSGFPTAREEVLNLLKELTGLNISNLRICITSRPEIDIRTVLEALTPVQVSLHDEIGQKRDILDYISNVVHSDQKMRRWRPEDKQLVIDTLSAKADGMYVIVTVGLGKDAHLKCRFRWVYCQLETLRRCFPTVLRRALDELPETLDETYERTLLGIEKEIREFSHRLFQCLTVAVRPLQLDELAEVLAIRFDAGQLPRYDVNWRSEDAQEAVLSACSSLIAVVNIDGSPVVQFAHFSVKEFLTSDRLANSTKALSRYHILPRAAHTILAQASLGVLLHLGNHVDKNNMENFPFARYAAEHWVEHGQFKDVSSSIEDTMECLFDLDEPSFATWIWIYDIDYPFRPHMFETQPTRPEAVPLYYATLCGFHDLVEHLVAAHLEDVNAIGGYHHTAVNAALITGNVEIALLLLEHGADVNIVDAEGWTPLLRASQSGRRDDVELLLKHHANVNLQERDGDTALHMAARNGELEIVGMLLRHGSVVGTPTYKGWTALKSASRYGHLDVVRLLIESGAAVDTPDNDGSTPLKSASGYGHLDVVRLLIESGAAVDTPSNEGWTPLKSASASGHLDVVRLLIESGAAVDTPDNDGWTPLNSASGYGHLDVVRLLIESGAAVDTPSNDGWTPLMSASAYGHLDVVRLLIESRAAVDTPEEDGRTALFVASESGHLHITQELLDHGASVKAYNSHLSTPLHAASANGHLSIVQLLTKYHADVDKRNKGHQTPLHLASRYEHLKTARFLIESRSSTDSQDGNGSTPLHIAAQYGHLGMVKLLIESGADVTVRNGKESTPLDLASTSGNHQVTMYLAEYVGADVPSLDKSLQKLRSGASLSSLATVEHTHSPSHEGITSLFTASSEGNVDVVRSLLDSGADINERNLSHNTALHVALDEEELEVAKLLIQYGADINCQEKTGWAPLHLASRNGYFDVVQLLLDHDADVNAKNQELSTPLHLAAWNSQVEVARLLLERGANVHLRDIEGRTPSVLASKVGERNLARLLSGRDGS